VSVARAATDESGYPVGLQRLVEQYLEGLDFGVDPRAGRLVEAMRYSLLAGGKRIRPVLALATASSRGADPAAVLPAAAALELVHTYSLIHDDLPAIDDDTLRRGKPTCHVAFGEDIAILAGDGLFAEAFRLLLVTQEGSSAARLAAAAEVARATGVRGMVGGQYMDVVGHARDDDDLRVLHALKTGRLIEAAVVCGALLTGAEPATRGAAAEPAARGAHADELAPYRAFAAELGLLFQIVDDILDEAGDEAELGKSVGKDRAQAKVTYVSRHGLDGARELARESYDRARARFAKLPGDTAALAAVTGYIFRRRS
jgi:geranylgeranyl diphosphate synthase type II